MNKAEKMAAYIVARGGCVIAQTARGNRREATIEPREMYLLRETTRTKINRMANRARGAI
jgi:hypothetical protein